VTLPSASRKLINTERSWSTDGARASSRSNRRERFLVVMFVSPLRPSQTLDGKAGDPPVQFSFGWLLSVLTDLVKPHDLP